MMMQRRCQPNASVGLAPECTLPQPDSRPDISTCATFGGPFGHPVDLVMFCEASYHQPLLASVGIGMAWFLDR